MIFNTNIENEIINKAKELHKKIVLPEVSYSKRVLEATEKVAEFDMANLVLLVKDDNEDVLANLKKYNNVEIINIKTSSLRQQLISTLYEKRKAKGLTLDQAEELVNNEIYFGTLLVEVGYADGMVCGAENTTADTLKPALQIIKGKFDNSTISTFMIMVSENKNWGSNGVFVLADCGLNAEPSATDLCQIVFDTVHNARILTNIEPKVALLSYSTLGSAEGESVQKMRDAKQLVLNNKPDFIIDGEYQLDSAIIPSVAQLKAKNGAIKGDANVLIFPDLASGNISYKLMQRFGEFKAIGPICQGLRKPINDLSRGANVNEIILTIAITSLQTL